MQHLWLLASGGIQRQLERIGDILCFHVGTQLPGDDVAGIVVQYSR
ncbi:hypothetical protein PsWM33_01003 [Pseudovibrio sp. WM33]|nr:hypothetical protein PsWM33_01003 [Pseudovibrio sp. WM33]